VRFLFLVAGQEGQWLDIQDSTCLLQIATTMTIAGQEYMNAKMDTKQHFQLLTSASIADGWVSRNVFVVKKLKNGQV
jgi:hypothetical protein